MDENLKAIYTIAETIFAIQCNDVSYDVCILASWRPHAISQFAYMHAWFRR